MYFLGAALPKKLLNVSQARARMPFDFAGLRLRRRNRNRAGSAIKHYAATALSNSRSADTKPAALAADRPARGSLPGSLSNLGGRGDCRLRETRFSTIYRPIVVLWAKNRRPNFIKTGTKQADLQPGRPKSDRLLVRVFLVHGISRSILCLERRFLNIATHRARALRDCLRTRLGRIDRLGRGVLCRIGSG